MQVGGYEQNPLFWDQVDPDFSYGLFDLDWDCFGANFEGGMTRVPIVGETGVRTTVCGPESFTPDHKPLLGEAPSHGVACVHEVDAGRAGACVYLIYAHLPPHAAVLVAALVGPEGGGGKGDVAHCGWGARRTVGSVRPRACRRGGVVAGA